MCNLQSFLKQIVQGDTFEFELTVDTEIEVAFAVISTEDVDPIYVDPSADVQGDGTENSPLQTLEQAKAKVRTILATTPNANITVYLKGGTYLLEETFALGQEDSSLGNVTYKNYTGECPVITSGHPIDGTFTKVEGKGYYSYQLPEDAEYGTKMARLLKMVSDKGIKTSVDAVSEEGDRFREKIIPALKYCDYTIMNEIECCKVTGLSPRKEDGSIDIDNIRTTMEAFMEYGVREKVIIHCCEAGFLLDKSGEFVIVPSLKLPKGYIKGSVGAGDSFAAACLYGIDKDFDNTEILEFASAAAACNLAAADSISGMKTRAEIEQMCEEFERLSLEEI